MDLNCINSWYNSSHPCWTNSKILGRVVCENMSLLQHVDGSLHLVLFINILSTIILITVLLCAMLSQFNWARDNNNTTIGLLIDDWYCFTLNYKSVSPYNTIGEDGEAAGVLAPVSHHYLSDDRRKIFCGRVFLKRICPSEDCRD